MSPRGSRRWLGLGLILALCACDGSGAADSARPNPPVAIAPAASAPGPNGPSASTAPGPSGTTPGAVIPGAPARPPAFAYSPIGRRDPFRSYLDRVKERQDAKAQDHRREETENFDLGQFRLVGLVTGTTQPKAMVDDPNGEAHVLRIGSRIGKNGGRVYSINAQGLTIVEEYVDASGKLVSVPLTVRLPDEVVHRPDGKE